MSTVTDSRYVTKAEFTRQKSRLTKAKNSGDPGAVLAAVETTLAEWSGKAWPDDWARWSRALDDAYYAYVRSERAEDEEFALTSRFHACFDIIHRGW